MKRRHFLVMSGAVVLGGCAAGPNYLAPTVALPAKFATGGTKSRRQNTDWWTELNDKQLNELVTRGLSQNLDIKIAMQRVAKAREELSGTGLPAQASGTFDASSTLAGGGGTATTTANSATLGATLALDIFGRARRNREQAGANLAASRFDAETARLTLLSSLVGAYIDARYFQEALAVTRQTVSSRRKTLALVQDKERIGASSSLDTTQAQAQLDQALALVPPLEARFNSAVFTIATLLAEPAAPILSRMTRGAPQPRPRTQGGVGTPAELLRYRPDVRSAERGYAASVAAVGVATADMYPALTLTGSITASSSNSWSFGPALSLPVFNQSVLSAKRRAAVALAQQRELEWRKAVLTAVQEVQIEQSNLVGYRRQAAALSAAVTSSRSVRNLYAKNFELGDTSLLDLLIVERNLSDAQLALTQAVRDTAASWTKLQVATGRGWMPDVKPA